MKSVCMCCMQSVVHIASWLERSINTLREQENLRSFQKKLFRKQAYFRNIKKLDFPFSTSKTTREQEQQQSHTVFSTPLPVVFQFHLKWITSSRLAMRTMFFSSRANRLVKVTRVSFLPKHALTREGRFISYKIQFIEN